MANARPSGCQYALVEISEVVSTFAMQPDSISNIVTPSSPKAYRYRFPSVQEAARFVPEGSNDTCLTALVGSLRVITFEVSLVLTMRMIVSLVRERIRRCTAGLTERTYSLATATHLPSGDSARSRTGTDCERTSISSNCRLSREYLATVLSSDPTMTKLSCMRDISSCLTPVAICAHRSHNRSV